MATGPPVTYALSMSTSRVVGLTVTAALVGIAGPALANPPEPPVRFELGLNTRHFAAESREMVAFRSTSPESGTFDGAAAFTASLRFTKAMRFQTFAGVEAETGMLAQHGSNIAGAYGVAGARGVIGRAALLVELASGRRWIRYGLGEPDFARWLVEPRVRAEVWVHPRFTAGGAIGATLGDQHVWMAGVYVGVHSLDFGSGTRR